MRSSYESPVSACQRRRSRRFAGRPMLPADWDGFPAGLPASLPSETEEA